MGVYQVEGVTLLFVIRFVPVYYIIHPGVQRAANMPREAHDHEKCMRCFSVETENNSEDSTS